MELQAKRKGLPAHIEAANEAIGQLHTRHRQRATPVERISRFIARGAGAAPFLFLVAGLVSTWIVVNVVGCWEGQTVIDPWPFQGLQSFASVAALFMTAIIFISQRRDDELSEMRERLTLELALLNEQRSAKLVALLEELRRDLPIVPDREDAEAKALGEPVDPHVAVAVVSAKDGGGVGSTSPPSAGGQSVGEDQSRSI